MPITFSYILYYYYYLWWFAICGQYGSNHNPITYEMKIDLLMGGGCKDECKCWLTAAVACCRRAAQRGEQWDRAAPRRLTTSAPWRNTRPSSTRRVGGTGSPTRASKMTTLPATLRRYGFRHLLTYTRTYTRGVHSLTYARTYTRGMCSHLHTHVRTREACALAYIHARHVHSLTYTRTHAHTYTRTPTPTHTRTHTILQS